MDIKKVGTILYMAIMVFYGVYTMVLSIQAYTKFSDTTQTYMNIASNLSQNLITDVQVSTTSCASGYSTIFDWNWQGTNEGCDCTTSTYGSVHNSYYLGACNSTELSKSCKKIVSVPSVSFDSIEGATNLKQQVCIKRGSQKFSDIAADQKGSCSSSQKTCGNPSKTGTVICVGSSDPCPVYNMKWSATVDTTTYPTSEWTQITLASGKYLYVNQKGTTSNTLPLSEFRFTQNGVCKLENTAKIIPSGAKDYLLVKTTRNTCSELDDAFIMTNLQVAENKYYSLNVPTSYWTQMLTWPSYAVPTSTAVFNSYYRPFINWNINNRDQVRDLVNSADSISNLKGAQLTVMVINILVCILVSIILQISQVYNLCGKDVPCIDGSGDSEQKRIVFIKKILTYGSKLLQAPFLLWAFIISAQKKTLLNTVADSSPSDTRYNGELQMFANQLENDVYNKNLIALIILCLTILLDIILWLKDKYCAKKTTGSTSVEPAKQSDEEEHIKQQNQSGATPNQSYMHTNHQQEMPSYQQNPQQNPQQYPQQQVYNPQFQQPVYVQPVVVQQPVVVYQPVQQPVVVYQQF